MAESTTAGAWAPPAGSLALACVVFLPGRGVRLCGRVAGSAGCPGGQAGQAGLAARWPGGLGWRGVW